MMRRLSTAILMLLMLTVARPCGPFVPTFHLVVVSIPDGDRSEWLAGRLGLIQPRLHTADLVIAWRWLAGLGLSEEEQKALGGVAASDGRPSGSEQWKKARAAAGAPELALETSRTVDYRDVPVVGDHALALAAETLLARIQQFGKESPAVNSWCAAQDRVFAWTGPNAAVMPEPAAASLPLLIRQDRAYQQAAALFYREKADEALKAFRAIAADRATPWRGWARYMVARIFQKYGPIVGDPLDVKEALAALMALQADAAFPEIHAPAAALENHLRYMEDPPEFYAGLIKHLGEKGRGPALAQDIEDLRWLRVLEPWTEGLKETAPAGVHAWIDRLQKGDLEDALKAYGADSSLPNLVAVMMLMTPNHPQVETYLKKAQAASLQPGPAYATLVSHRLRILMAQKRGQAAEALADEAMGRPGASRWPSAFNLWSSVKLSRAKDVDGFAAHVGRRLASIEDGYDTFDSEHPDEGKDAEGKEDHRVLKALDPMAVALLNRNMPLRLWEGVLSSARFPSELKPEWTEALWTRAAILEREDVMRRQLPALKALRPELGKDLEAWAAEPDAARRKASAFFLIWEHRLWPQLLMMREEAFQFGTVYARWEGAKKESPAPAPAAHKEEAPRGLSGYGMTLAPAFLEGAARQEGEAEAAKIPAPLTWFCEQALAYAEAHPEDAQVPEALSRAVRASRNANRDDRSAPLVLKAFRLLHKKYPNSPGAKEAKVYH
jgi:hypothetical protein